MARMGVFSRNDSTPDSIPRSLQLLNHRSTFDARYMEIYPNFSEILNPNESISLQVTNFVRSIPMKRPMLTRVRVYQRFCAVPLRILWSAWEDYIKGENDSQFLLEEPYIVNATDDGSSNQHEPGYWKSGQAGIGVDGGFGAIYRYNVSNHVVQNMGTPDISSVPQDTTRYRGIMLTQNSWIPEVIQPPTTGSKILSDNHRSGYAKFGVHELGDYFNHPLYVSSGKVEVDEQTRYEVPFSAFKFAAYQLAYSFFDRMPNVQKRVDDFYQMSKYKCFEYPSLVAAVARANGDSGEWQGVPPGDFVRRYDLDEGYEEQRINLPRIYRGVTWNSDSYRSHTSPRDIASNNDPSSVTYQQDVIRSSWENVEKFPLKGGANLSMLAQYADPNSGLPTYVPSNISLTRKRFANWQTDYFTSCNPWQQRGDEAQIPVSGSIKANIGDFTVSVVPNGVVTSSFTGTADTIPVTVSGEVMGDTDTSLGDLRVFSTPNDGSGFLGTTRDPSTGSQGVSLSGETDEFVPRGNVTSVFYGTRSVGTGSGTVSVAQSALYVSPSNFRFAMTLQHIKEMQAQIDNRYQSYIHKFFGARARDYRLDRPEFIGGSVMELSVSDVNQTSETTSESPLGDVAGKSVSAGSSRVIRYHADEHTVILGTLHIVPDTEYIGGMPREDSTKDRFDWVLPQFSHLSEQAVYNKELSFHGIFGSDNRAKNDEVFGYEPVLNHLRWKPNRATGTFRDFLNSTGNFEEYKPWIITRNFGASINSVTGEVTFNQPTLSDEFLSGRYGRDNSNFDVTDDEQVYPFMVDSYFNERLVRVISSRGTPSRLGA